MHTMQQLKLTASMQFPMESIPIGSPWQIIAIDVHEFPLSFNNNHYLLVEPLSTR